MNNDSIDWNNDFSYPLQWIYESWQARRDYQCMLHRVNKAMMGKPSRNLYAEELESNVNKIDGVEKEAYRKICQNVPEGESFIVRQAVENRANQMASGVDTYEYHIDDPYMIIDGETEDLLAAKCQQDYVESKLGIMAGTFSRDLTKYGMTAVLVKYNEKGDKNRVIRINPKNVWFDTMYSATGCERFRGYSTMISFSKLRDMIEKGGDIVNTELQVPDRSIFTEKGSLNKKTKYANKKITTLNDLSFYVEDLNKLASTPQLQAGLQDYFEYDHDLRNCYNLNWYRTFATDPVAKTKSGYNGDDVELTVMYDLDRKIEFKIINRKYVISANTKSFRRNIKYEITNPVTQEQKTTMEEFCLECPLKFQYEEQENRDMYPYPVSPLFSLLDQHDKLCSWRAKREHVSKILSILRIETNGADAASLRGVLNIMGVVLDDIQGDIGTVQFAYDYNPIDSQIAYLEETLKRTLHAYDDFDAMQNMGDRASAAESGMALGAIAQGLSGHQNAIMQLYADIARQCIGNRVTYSKNNNFRVNNLGDCKTITIQEMALNAVVNVKSKLSKKVQEKLLASNAITTLGALRDMLTPEGQGYFVEQALFGNVSRSMAAKFIVKPEPSQQALDNNALQAQNTAQALQQNQAMYEDNPIPYEVNDTMQNMSPEEIDQVIAGLAAQQSQGGEMAIEPETSDLAEAMPEGQDMGGIGTSPEGLDMTEQDGAMASGMDFMTPEAASAQANPNSLV